MLRQRWALAKQAGGRDGGGGGGMVNVCAPVLLPLCVLFPEDSLGGIGDASVVFPRMKIHLRNLIQLLSVLVPKHRLGS